jgi:hypothetical protein
MTRFGLKFIAFLALAITSRVIHATNDTTADELCASVDRAQSLKWGFIPLGEEQLGGSLLAKLQHAAADNSEQSASESAIAALSPSTSNPRKYPFEPFSWIDLDLAVKDQGDTTSCMSQSLTTLLEAYFKRRGLASNEWSGFDLYYCKLKLFKSWIPLTLKTAVNKRIASADCTSSQQMANQLREVCPERRTCDEPTAIIRQIKQFEPKGNTAHIIKMLRQYGPLMGIVIWTEAISDYSVAAGRDYVESHRRIFRKKEWKTPDACKLDTLKRKVGELLNGHAVTIVGYDYDEVTGELFWIILNSHSKYHGFDGYLYVAEKELGLIDMPMTYLEEAQLGAPLS